MPKLTGVLSRLGGRPGDRGAVASLVAVLLAGGVLLGMGALVVDVGLLYVEREQLQSGADAAAVAVARVCVEDAGRCHPEAMAGLAREYAGENDARDGLADAAVCGRVKAPARLPDCGPEPSNRTRCLGSRPSGSRPYVEVHTTTRVEGGTALPPAFAGAVTGTDGVTVGACARVSWGPAREVTTDLGIAICETQFNAATHNGTVFQPPPRDGAHQADHSAEIVLRMSTTGTSCGGTSGGFVWITRDGSGPTCPHRLAVGTDEHVAESTDDISGNCAAALSFAVNDRQPVPVVIYRSGASGRVTTVGIAMFVPTGWRYRGQVWTDGPTPRTRSSTLSGDNLCGSDPATICLYGYFTLRVVPDPGHAAPVGHHYGAVFIRTIG